MSCLTQQLIVDTYIIKALIIVHSEPPVVLQLSDPVAQDGLLVADTESQIPSELCGILHQEQPVRSTVEQFLNLRQDCF